ncbi:MAG: efflux RND transporter periplasmic adaptor subunit [Cyclobacteriaceae bacterium]
MRQVIIAVIGLLILAAGVFGFMKMKTSKERPPRKVADNTATVFVEKVALSAVPLYIEATGLLTAREKFELYSEVQGTMLPDGGKFREGIFFKKGQVLMAIRSDDVRAQLVAQRSSFQQLVTSIMPDLKLDYPDEFRTWSDYLNNLSPDKSVQKLPEVTNDQLRLFLTGRNLYSEYYNIKTSEINLSKFVIRAPYDGLLTEANADPGTVIRQGQKLGVFIKPDIYELKVPVRAELADKVSVGKTATLSMDDRFEKTWEGKVTRINRTVNTTSQLSSVFIRTNSDDLKNGMFLHARIYADDIPDAIEVSRSVLFDNNKVFVVEGDLLVEKEVVIRSQADNTAIITGLENGDQLLTKIPPGSFAGMKVNIYKKSQG